MSWLHLGDQVNHDSLHYAQENFVHKTLEGMIVGVFRDKTYPFKTELAYAKIISYYNDKEYSDIQLLDNMELSQRNNFLGNNPELFFLEGWPHKDGVLIYNFGDNDNNNNNNNRIYTAQSIELTDYGIKVRLLDIDSIDNTARWRQSILRDRMKKTLFKGFDDDMLRDKLLKDYVDKKIIEFYQNPYLNIIATVTKPRYLTLNIHKKMI